MYDAKAIERRYKSVTKRTKEIEKYYQEGLESCRSALDYKLLYNRLKKIEKDKTPVHYSNKNGDVTVYNKSFRPIYYKYKRPITDLTETPPLSSHYSFRFERSYSNIVAKIAACLKSSKVEALEYLTF